MKIRPIIIITILLFVSLCFIASSAEAEQFRVLWSLLGLHDESRLQVSPDIDIDFMTEFTEDEEATTVAVEVLTRELEEGHPNTHVAYMLESIKKENELWYLKFMWEYESAVKQGVPYRYFFNLKIDLQKRVVVYARSIESSNADQA